MSFKFDADAIKKAVLKQAEKNLTKDGGLIKQKQKELQKKIDANWRKEDGPKPTVKYNHIGLDPNLHSDKQTFGSFTFEVEDGYEKQAEKRIREILDS